METLVMILAALILDQWLGEPRRWHPLVGLGSLAHRLERYLNVGSPGRRLLNGLAAWSLLVVAPALVLALLAEMAPPLLQYAIGPVILWLCIGRRSLREHTLPIVEALLRGDLNYARERTGYIVSRDTRDMDEKQISRAATESILENGNDAVIAPIFWFVLAGPAGCVAHRAINTLDAMWGYRNERFEWFGKWAARADDVAAWVPARMTALGYAIGGNTRGALEAWRRDAGQLASPNGGPCMTAGAGALGVTLGGPCEYGGKRLEKPFFGGSSPCTPGDIKGALALLDRALFFTLVSAAMVLVLLQITALTTASPGGTS